MNLLSTLSSPKALASGPGVPAEVRQVGDELSAYMQQLLANCAQYALLVAALTAMLLMLGSGLLFVLHFMHVKSAQPAVRIARRSFTYQSAKRPIDTRIARINRAGPRSAEFRLRSARIRAGQLSN